MGAVKQLLPYVRADADASESAPLVAHVARQALEFGAGTTLVVTGAHAERVGRVLPQGARGVHHAGWAEGQGSSLAAGVRYLLGAPGAGCEAAFVLLADQPFVSAALLREMSAAFAKTRPDAVALRYPSGAGVPALFSRAMLERLTGGGGGGGAKAVLRDARFRTVVLERAWATRDVDTREDYLRLVGPWVF